MEEDRAIAKLGGDPDHAVGTDSNPTPKQPRKRFTGRRAVAARAAANGDQKADPDGTTNALQAPRPHRAPRLLNQIPKDILEDPDLQAAIAHLPSNYNFEIPKTIHRIRSSGSKNIALQFPEGLLLFAPLISDILTRFCPGADTLIMGDVTYGACCIDDYTARALGCDLLVHYGHSCLVPVDQTGGIKTLYVFVTIGIDVEHLIRTIEANFQSGKKIALVGTIQFNTTLNSITGRLRNMGYEILLPRSAPLSAGEILGCTAPTLISRSSTAPANVKATQEGGDADMILYIGDGRFHLESILIASPTLRAHTYRYDPYSRRLTHETYEHEEMHSLRRHAIQTARRTLVATRSRKSRSLPMPGPTSTTTTTTTTAPVATPTPSSASAPELPTTWGIILGTLGRQGNPHTLSLITAHLSNLGIPYITLFLSEIQPAKIALMSRDVGVWVQIACPRLSIDWGYAFERPLLSPYEAMVALGMKEGGKWAGGAGNDIGTDSNERGPGDADLEVALGEKDTAVYPMDFYGKDGLGRTRAEDVPALQMEIEVV